MTTSCGAPTKHGECWRRVVDGKRCYQHGPKRATVRELRDAVLAAARAQNELNRDGREYDYQRAIDATNAAIRALDGAK